MYSRNQISIKGNFSRMSLCIASRVTAVQPLYSGYQLSARRHRQLRHTSQGPVTVPPSRLGASVQRANRPELGAFTSSGGTANDIRVWYQYHPRGSVPLLREPTVLAWYLSNYSVNCLRQHSFHHKQNHNHSQTKWQCAV